MARRKLLRDVTGASANAALKDQELVFDDHRKVLRLGDGQTVGGKIFDANDPLSQNEWASMVRALMCTRGRERPIPIDLEGSSDTAVVDTAEVVLDGPILRVGDGVSPGGLEFWNPKWKARYGQA